MRRRVPDVLGPAAENGVTEMIVCANKSRQDDATVSMNDSCVGGCPPNHCLAGPEIGYGVPFHQQRSGGMNSLLCIHREERGISYQ